jgi:hypothetical protein
MLYGTGIRSSKLLRRSHDFTHPPLLKPVLHADFTEPDAQHNRNIIAVDHDVSLLSSVNLECASLSLFSSGK